MACPFFMPKEKFDGWPNRPRLPLGHGWQGFCTAPGHEGERPSDRELKDFCNFGYAKRCSRLPDKRACDAVRFAVSREVANKIVVCFVCELDHRPAEHGELEYDAAAGSWTVPHRDACVLKMAECYLESYLERRGKGSRTARGTS